MLVSAGVKPDVGLARAAGLEIGGLGGIVVDGQMRTSDPAVWAVGDAVEVPDFVTGQPALVALAGPAVRQARVAADAICGRPSRYRGAQGTGVVGLFGLTLAITGASEKGLRRSGLPFQKIYVHAPDHASYYPGAQTMTIKLLFAPGDGRLLGAQAVGRGGVDKRIDVLATALQHGATVFDLEEAELCYAPQYGSAKDPVNMAGFVAANVLRGDVGLAHWSELPRRAKPAGQPRARLPICRRWCSTFAIRPKWPPPASPAARPSRWPSSAAGWPNCPPDREIVGPLRRRPAGILRLPHPHPARLPGPQSLRRPEELPDAEGIGIGDWGLGFGLGIEWRSNRCSNGGKPSRRQAKGDFPPYDKRS